MTQAKKVLEEIKDTYKCKISKTIGEIEITVFAERLDCELFLREMEEYLPKSNRNVRYPLKVVYSRSDLVYEKFLKVLHSEKGKVHIIYKNAEKAKKALRYELDGIDFFYNSMDDYILGIYEDYIYIFTTHKTQESDRLFFRVIVEFIISIKEVSGFLMIHGGAVALDGKGFLICGEKKAGKSTLIVKLLKYMGTKFIANDKTFVTPDYQEIESYPMVVKLGETTFRYCIGKDRNIKLYRKNANYQYVQKEDFTTDKWELTPHELADIMGREYVLGAKLHMIIIPEIVQGTTCSLKKIDTEKKNFLEESNLFGDSLRREEWILSDYWKWKISKQKNVNKIEIPVYKLQYGSETAWTEIIRVLRECTNSIKGEM